MALTWKIGTDDALERVEACEAAVSSSLGPCHQPRTFDDFARFAFQAYHLVRFDIRDRFTRTVLGPYWVTISQAVFVFIVGSVWSAASGTPWLHHLAFVGLSYCAWTWFHSSCMEATMAFVACAPYVRDRGVHWMVFCFLVIFRQATYFAYGLLIPVAIAIWSGRLSLLGCIAAMPGLLLFAAMTVLCVTPVAVAAARFRDMKPILESGMLILMLATPVIWSPANLPAGRSLLVDVNPLAHFFAVWREPLLQGSVSGWSFVVCIASIGVLALLNVAALRAMPRAAFWT